MFNLWAPGYPSWDGVSMRAQMTSLSVGLQLQQVWALSFLLLSHYTVHFSGCPLVNSHITMENHPFLCSYVTNYQWIIMTHMTPIPSKVNKTTRSPNSGRSLDLAARFRRAFGPFELRGLVHQQKYGLPAI
jgi:hypothetical protein